MINNYYYVLEGVQLDEHLHSNAVRSSGWPNLIPQSLSSWCFLKQYCSLRNSCLAETILLEYGISRENLFDWELRPTLYFLYTFLPGKWTTSTTTTTTSSSTTSSQRWEKDYRVFWMSHQWALGKWVPAITRWSGRGVGVVILGNRLRRKSSHWRSVSISFLPISFFAYFPLPIFSSFPLSLFLWTLSGPQDSPAAHLTRRPSKRCRQEEADTPHRDATHAHDEGR